MLNKVSQVIAFDLPKIRIAKRFDGFEATTVILNKMATSYQRRDEFAEFAALHRMPFHEYGWIVVLAEELQNILIFLRSRYVPYCQQSLEVSHSRPDKVAAKVGSLVELVGSSHRFEINSEHFTATT
jgi:hypothetical protein